MSILLPSGFGCTSFHCQGANTSITNNYQGPLCLRGEQYKIHTEPEVVRYTCPAGITRNVSSTVFFTNQTYNQGKLTLYTSILVYGGESSQFKKVP